MLRKVNIAKRSLFVFGITGLIVVLLGLFAINNLDRLNEATDVVTEHRVPALVAVGEMRRDFLRIRIHNAVLLTGQSNAENETTLEHLVKVQNTFASAYERMDELARASEARQLMAEIRRLKNEYDDALKAYYELVEVGNYTLAKSIRDSKLEDFSRQITDLLNGLSNYQTDRAKDAAIETDNVFIRSSMAISIGIVLVLAFLILIAITFTRSVVLPIRQSIAAADIIATGDLTQSLHDKHADEPAQLIRALDKMKLQLRETIDQISSSSSQLASTAEELNVVTSGANELVDNQNRQIEQAATAVSELSYAIDEVAENASSTSLNSEKADAKTREGYKTVLEAVETSKVLSSRINDSKVDVAELATNIANIATVLDVIRSIADQTNLLSLNAAIEAARAGESGRGFAVVADEVRALAHRTQESTKEIEKVIKQVQEQTDEAVAAMELSVEGSTQMRNKAELAASVINEITSIVKEIKNQNTAIATAAEQQSTVSVEVDKNLINVKELSTEVSAGTSQTNASSIELAKLAEALNQLVFRFKI